MVLDQPFRAVQQAAWQPHNVLIPDFPYLAILKPGCRNELQRRIEVRRDFIRDDPKLEG